MGVLIYIAGYGRSGSSAIDAYLSSAPRCIGVGEAVNLFDEIVFGGHCACGEPILKCEVWQFLANELHCVDIHSLKGSSRRVETLFAISNRNDVYKYNKFWSLFFDRMFDNYDVVIDSSKTARTSFFRPKRLEKLVDRLVIVFVVRDSKRLMGSLKKGSNKYLKGDVRGKSGLLFLLRSVVGVFVSYLGAVYSARRTGAEVVILRHEEFVVSPGRVLGTLSDIGVTIDAPAKYGPGHGISGNRSRGHFQGVVIDSEKLELSLVEQGLALLIRGAQFAALRLLPADRTYCAH